MWQFIAKFDIKKGEEGFHAGKLIFGEKGTVLLSTRHDDSQGRATIGIEGEPFQEIVNGTSFVARCSVSSPEYWEDKIAVGYKFTICYPTDIADAEIIKVLCNE
jgi:hypothetical protein